MSKNNSVYVCQNCSYQIAKWMGRCPTCQEWNTFEESSANVGGRGKSEKRNQEIKTCSLSEVQEEKLERYQTGIGEFDRVIGGGLVDGSLILIGGEPGIGKSTLLLQALAGLALKGKKVLYVSGEESLGQIAGRAKRLGINIPSIQILQENEWERVKETIKKIKPDVLVIDSIQTTISEELDSPPGSLTQIREVTYEIMNHVKGQGMSCFIIGHITKEGAIAGPKVLEHMVDTVIYFEGDQLGHYRLLRAIKNRFGNTNEVGIFEMQENGLIEIKNPSQIFLDDISTAAFGRAVTSIIEGSRTLLIEIQSLVVENKFGNGKRTTQGIDTNRLGMLVAVIEKYLAIPFSFNDIYANVVGNIKLKARESDLAVVASLFSSLKSFPLDEKSVFLGEVGLTGEVRSVPMLEARLKELSQLQYKTVYIPESQKEIGKKISGIRVVPVATVKELYKEIILKRNPPSWQGNL